MNYSPSTVCLENKLEVPRPLAVKDYLLALPFLVVAFATVQCAYQGREHWSQFLYADFFIRGLTALHILLGCGVVIAIFMRPRILTEKRAFVYLLIVACWGLICLALSEQRGMSYLRMCSHLLWFLPIAILLRRPERHLDLLLACGVIYSAIACILFLLGVRVETSRGCMTIADYPQLVALQMCTALILFRPAPIIRKALYMLPIAGVFFLTRMRHAQAALIVLLILAGAFRLFRRRIFAGPLSLNKWFFISYALATVTVICLHANKPLVEVCFGETATFDYHYFDLFRGIVDIAHSPLRGSPYEFERWYHSTDFIYLHSDLVGLWRRFGVGGAWLSFVFYWLPVGILSPQFKSMSETARSTAIAIAAFSLVSAVIGLVLIPQITWEQNCLLFAYVTAIAFSISRLERERLRQTRPGVSSEKMATPDWEKGDKLETALPFLTFSGLSLALVFCGERFATWLYHTIQRGDLPLW